MSGFLNFSLLQPAVYELCFLVALCPDQLIELVLHLQHSPGELGLFNSLAVLGIFQLFMRALQLILVLLVSQLSYSFELIESVFEIGLPLGLAADQGLVVVLLSGLLDPAPVIHEGCFALLPLLRLHLAQEAMHPLCVSDLQVRLVLLLFPLHQRLQV